MQKKVIVELLDMQVFILFVDKLKTDLLAWETEKH